MQVQTLKLEQVDFGNQWFDEILDRWTYDDFTASREWKRGWISFDCAYYHPSDDRVYLGITSFDSAAIFKAYDRKLDRFIDLGYGRMADRFDAKFHRSLVMHSDGCLYAAPALLHCPDKYAEAPGASIVRFDPATGRLDKLGIVIPHVYIQALALDRRRDRLYCQCFAPEYLASFDLRTGESKTLALLGSGYGGMAQGENLVLDDAGGLWCNWSLTRAWQDKPGIDAARLCRYDPQTEQVQFFAQGLPQPDGRPGFAKAESFFNFGDGPIYASGANGSLYRVDPATAKAQWLFTPTPDRPSRLSSLVKAADGVAYGVTGRGGQCELLRVEYKTGKFAKLGSMVDPDGVAMYQCHDIVISDDGTLYACENDNPYRSSYLWAIRPED
ncbi:MAG: hypothetical protein HUU20_21490 [Pirellulales bacterium]|nr:hypothetical protein [Pirellulales bacterium]